MGEAQSTDAGNGDSATFGGRGDDYGNHSHHSSSHQIDPFTQLMNRASGNDHLNLPSVARMVNEIQPSGIGSSNETMKFEGIGSSSSSATPLGGGFGSSSGSSSFPFSSSAGESGNEVFSTTFQSSSRTSGGPKITIGSSTRNETSDSSKSANKGRSGGSSGFNSGSTGSGSGADDPYFQKIEETSVPDGARVVNLERYASNFKSYHHYAVMTLENGKKIGIEYSPDGVEFTNFHGKRGQSLVVGKGLHSINRIKTPKRNCTVGDLKKIAKEYDKEAKYNLTTHNCQQFVWRIIDESDK